MSVYEEIRKKNLQNAIELSKSNIEHLNEMAKKSTTDSLVPKNAVKETWDRRQVQWCIKKKFTGNIPVIAAKLQSIR